MPAHCIKQRHDYTRAAQKLGITKPAVSRRVVALEQELRTKLFRRDGHRFLPTEAGMSVCDHARRIVSLVDALPTSVQEIAGHPSGTLALGVPSALGEILLPRLVRTYKARYPNVFLRVEQGYAGDLFDMLAANQVEVAILYGKPVTSMIELTPLIDLELGLVYPKVWKKAAPTAPRSDSRVSSSRPSSGPCRRQCDGTDSRPSPRGS